MRKLLVITTLLMMSSCGDKKYYNEYVSEPDVAAPESPKFSGYFVLDGGSDANCIYLDQKAENVIDIESDCQSLVSVNPQNSTLGQFPTISASNLIVLDGAIRFTKNLNFTAGNDLEEDVSGANITGSRRTDVLITFEDSKLKLVIKVYKSANNNNLNEIIATRTFSEL